jgi:hypothetical protein
MLHPDQGPTKQCTRCGNERTLFYFPVRKAHPDGWVHCYACQYEQRLEVRPFRRCAPCTSFISRQTLLR